MCAMVCFIAEVIFAIRLRRTKLVYIAA